MKFNKKGAAQSIAATTLKAQKKEKHPFLVDLVKNKQLYMMIAIPFIYILVFKYYPMIGAQIAFKKYTAVGGVWGSKCVGFDNFVRFFNNPKCWEYIKNTFIISIYQILLTLPFPIFLALCLDYCRSKFFRKTVQMMVYLPHFLSTVIVVSVMFLILDNRMGIVNNIIYNLTGSKINFLGKMEYFRSLYVWSGVWQNTGWGSVLYIAALSAVDPQIHEAAIIDGANKFHRIWHIDLVAIRPTIIIMAIRQMGHVVSVGFDKIYLMQNSVNLPVSEVLSTYEYKIGIGANLPDFSYTAAIGLMLSVIHFVLIVASNKIANQLSGSGLW